MSKKNGHFFLGLVLGSTTAFAAALFLAPKTGADTQNKIKNLKDRIQSKGQQYYDYVAETTDDFRDNKVDKFGALKDKAVDKFSDLDLADKVAAAKQPFDSVTSNLRDHFGAAKDQLSQQLEGQDSDKTDYDDIVIDATAGEGENTQDSDTETHEQSAFQEAKEAAEAQAPIAKATASETPDPSDGNDDDDLNESNETSESKTDHPVE